MKYKIPELKIDEDLKINLDSIEKIIDNLNQRRDKGLSEDLEKKIKKQLMVSHVYHSNAIEGNQLTLRETELILNNMVINERPLKDELEARDLAAATEYLQDLISGYETINYKTLIELHQLVLRSSNEKNAGVFRNVNVQIKNSDHNPPDFLHVETNIKDMFQWMNRNMSKYHPLELGAIIHHWITWVHPFADGNGRVARLFLNFFLLQKGYPEVTIRIQERDKYYDALIEADGGKIENLISLISENVRKSVDLIETFINDEERKKEWANKFKQEGEKRKKEAISKHSYYYNIWNSNMDIFKNIIQRCLDDISDSLSHLEIDYESYDFSINKYLDMLEGKPVSHNWIFKFSIFDSNDNRRWVFVFYALPMKYKKPLRMLGVDVLDKKTGKNAYQIKANRILIGISHRKGGEYKTDHLKDNIDLVNISSKQDKIAFRVKNRKNKKVRRYGKYRTPFIVLDKKSSPDRTIEHFLSQILRFYFDIYPKEEKIEN